MTLQTVNQGVKVEWKVKLEGEKPITVNWLKNGAKMKASRNVKLNYIARTGEVIKLCRVCHLVVGQI